MKVVSLHLLTDQSTDSNKTSSEINLDRIRSSHHPSDPGRTEFPTSQDRQAEASCLLDLYKIFRQVRTPQAPRAIAHKRKTL